MRDADKSTGTSRRISPALGLLLAATGPLACLACGGLGERSDASLAGTGGASGAGGEVGPGVDGDLPWGEAPGETQGPDPVLLGAPLTFNPTGSGFALNAVLAKGNPSSLRAHVRAQGAATWEGAATFEVRGGDVAQWSFDGLGAGARYDYEILAAGASGDTSLYSGSTVTQRQPGDSFTFALISDSHIGADLSYTNQGKPATLKAVSAEAGAVSPDFIVNLGDMLDFHEYGFNDPPPSGSVTRLAYLNYRTLLGDTLGRAAHYATIGNWEGENGNYTAEEMDWSREQRLLYMPGPTPATYPQAGSPNQDYYAFTWGDALFIVLNVMSYTPTEHLLSSANAGLPDDWTLGEAQFDWFADTLAGATSKWRFVLIHHAVGGAAGNDINSAYGRGGGQAAHVGEQAKVHQLMLDHGAQIFFYGHDHVFTDMQVDGIHYSEPGSAGSIWPFTASETGYSQSWPDSGWGQVTVSPAAVNVRFVKMGGGVLYEYTLP